MHADKCLRDALDAIWKDIMLNQFHDVIPGTSIRMANEDAWAIYDARSEQTEDLIQQAMEVLLTSSDRQEPSQRAAPVVIDPLRLARREVIDYKSGDVGAETIQSLWIETDGSGIGHVTKTPSSMEFPTATVTGDQAVLENSHFRLVISEGRVTSLIDIQLQRELIAPGPGAKDAGLMLYDDFPLAYDAWDAEIYHLDMCRELKFTKVEVVRQDKLRASIRATASFGSSKVALEVCTLIHLNVDIGSSVDSSRSTQSRQTRLTGQIYKYGFKRIGGRNIVS